MWVVGLTGGIATGKSTVSGLLRDKGVPIVDADIIARKVVEPGTTGLKQIVKYFGEVVLFPDGSLDRKKLGSVIFNDESKRKRLNTILHPAIRRMMVWEVVKHWLCGKKYCVLDVPLLIEGPLWKWVAQVAVVYCPEEIQLERLVQRDGSTREDASARLSSQLSIVDKVKYADVVIDNSGTRENLESQVTALVYDLEKTVGWTWMLSWLIPPYGILSAAWILTRRAISRKTKSN
ncbi:CoaE-domain-containing protein [Guyanagaster necrorhizus]|uniref:CoaE-domain-containing protein n=1 Tax=Guyanagaster necrorhizus TaxID=856835 RepID=A0A9P7VLP6_9AGAR|nr:CoaE-domain-containing protein [Guyanagaster necrorhizus MCA 3950]KAG7442853.1 CoaE-domain-containing protein [Guyanagaster necrorhizus MCA 3950]